MMKRTIWPPLLLTLALATWGCDGNDEMGDCTTSSALCAAGTTCDTASGQCVAETTESCQSAPSLCGEGSSCDAASGQCVSPGAPSCVSTPTLCAAGTSCDAASGACKPVPMDCRQAQDTCAQGSSCDATSGQCVPEVDCRQDAALCGQGTTCDAATGTCAPDAQPDCRQDAALCGQGTTCDGTTGMCTQSGDCRQDATLCGQEASCDTASGRCITQGDCRQNAALCGEGTRCDADGTCALEADCREQPGLCGPTSVCLDDGRCAADCRTNLMAVCGAEQVCDVTSGACIDAESCAQDAGLCLDAQTCDTASGYCREAMRDDALAYDVELYDVTLTLDTANESFQSTARIYLSATAPTDTVVLNAARTRTYEVPGAMPEDPAVEVEFLSYTVSSVTDASGAALTYVHDTQAGTLSVTLPTALTAGQTAIVVVEYAGEMNPHEELGVVKFERKDGLFVYGTMGWPDQTRSWLPSHDHPSDTARAILEVGTDDPSLDLIANGVKAGTRVENGVSYQRFALRRPVPTYALNVTASDYKRIEFGVIDGVEIAAMVYAEDRDRLAERWGDVLGAFSFFSELLGQYEFESYTMVEHPLSLGAMEHATIVSIGEGTISGADSGRETVIHELVHHWYGDSAHQDAWSDFWLNESLAVYMVALYNGTTLLDGYTDRALPYQQHLNGLREDIFFLEQYAPYFSAAPLSYDDGPQGDVVPGAESLASAFAPYYKGPWIWHAIRVRMDDDALFWQLLRDFYQSHRFARYSTASLLAMLEAATGDQWDRFFQDWVYSAGWPVIAPTWSYDTTQVNYTLRQTQVAERGWTTFELSGPFALELAFDDEDPTTPTCAATVSFDGVATMVSGSVACPYAPTRLTVVNRDTFLAEYASSAP